MKYRKKQGEIWETVKKTAITAVTSRRNRKSCEKSGKFVLSLGSFPRNRSSIIQSAWAGVISALLELRAFAGDFRLAVDVAEVLATSAKRNGTRNLRSLGDFGYKKRNP
jgi:hypothetical protein